jgi:flavin-dependent dehydrogenase
LSRQYDVIIVGCGPSGNTLAFQWVSRGRSVLLLEKEILPRRKVCGGGLSRKAILELPYSVHPVYERTIESVLLTHSDGQVLVKSLEGAGGCSA